MSPKDRRLAAATCLSLGAAVFLIYARVTGFGFLELDDDAYVTCNPHVLAGITRQGLSWAFTSVGYAANWHPLTWVSHMVDVEAFGLRAGGPHLVNVSLHALNAVALFLVGWRMTGALRASAFVAALFAVHPLNVESVAWVAERKNVLSTFFWFLTLAAHLRYVRGPTVGRYLALFLVFAAGLLSKPMLVTLPLVLVLLDYWPLGRLRATAAESGAASGPPWRLVLEKVPLLGLAAGSATLTYLAQSRGGLVESLQDYSMQDRVANAALAYVAYAGKMIWPANLAFFYPHLTDAWHPAAPAAAGVLLAGVTLAALLLARRHPCVPVGWCWYVGTLVPVIGLVKVGSQGMADRYAYVPLVGLLLCIVGGAGRLDRTGRVRRAALAAGGAALLLLAAAAGRQVSVWRDGGALLSHTLACTDRNWFAENNFGVYLSQQGRHDEALAHYARAVAIAPSLTLAHYNWGVALAAQMRWAEAVDHYREVIRLMPDLAAAHVKLADALACLGKPAQSLDAYRQALRLGADASEARYGMGQALEMLGREEEAAAQYREVLRRDPAHRGAQAGLERIRLPK